MKYIHTINKIGLWIFMMTLISFQVVQAQAGESAEPCEDLSWLDQWTENDCCFIYIEELYEEDTDEYIYHVVPHIPEFCPTDGPTLGYFLDCEGEILCVDYSAWTGEDSCTVYSSLPNGPIIWESTCGDVGPECDPTFSCDPGPEGEIFFFSYAFDAVSWLWELDGEVISTEPEFIFYGNIGDTHSICLTVVGQSGCEDTFCNEFTVIDDLGGDGCFDPMQFDPDVDCTTVYEPVCGCDGITYGNECEATAWGGVTSWTPGECGAINDSCFFAPNIEVIFMECYGTEDIPQSFAAGIFDFQASSTGGDYLNWSFSNGWEDDLENDYVTGVEFVYIENGIPMFEPVEVCLTVGDSEFGCEETYCTLVHLEDFLEDFCFPDLPCIDESLIDVEVGCDDVYDPVCGCDGVTYENACTATYGHGVVEYIPGACEDLPCAYVWFAYEIIEENTLLIFDQSYGNSPIISWLWEVDGIVVSEESEFTLPMDSMVFYDICLTITTESDCEESFCMPVDIFPEDWVMDDEFFGNSGEVIDGNVLENDILPENWNWMIGDYTSPAFGALDFDMTTGEFSYIAADGFVGVDFFHYYVCDASFTNCYEGTVFLVIEDPNSFTLNPDYIEVIVEVDASIVVCPLDNDNITNDYNLTFAPFGGATIDGDCMIIEVVDLELGTYEVSYTVCNEITDECFTSIITIFVIETGVMPTVDAENDYVSGDSNTEIVINPLLNDTGIDDATAESSIELVILDEPENGIVYISTIEDCEVDCQIFVYEPNINFIGSDQFTYLICIDGTCDEATVYIEVGTDCSEFCVWPGDANNDGLANNFDVLTLGLNYGAMGVQRPNATTEWTAQPSPNWNESITENTEVDLKIADCDGNGIINDADMEVVYQNYGLSHGKTDDENEDGPSLRLEIQDGIIEPGTWMDIDVILEGLDGIALENVYGVAFQIDYFNEIDGTEIIPSDSINLSFIDSWFNNDGADNTLDFYKNLYELDESSKADIAFVRTNKESVNGNGPILKMSCFITANITGKVQDNIPIEFHLNTGKIMYQDGTLQDINVGTASAEIETPVGVGINTLLDTQIDIYPNPTKDFLQIDLGNVKTQNVTLYNNTGQIVKQINTQRTGNITMTTNTLPVGLYVLSIETTEGVLHKKVQIIQ